MLTTIRFDNKSCIKVHEIDDVLADRMLPAKLGAEELLGAEVEPEGAFSGGEVRAEGSGT